MCSLKVNDLQVNDLQVIVCSCPVGGRKDPTLGVLELCMAAVPALSSNSTHEHNTTLSKKAGHGFNSGCECASPW